METKLHNAQKVFGELCDQSSGNDDFGVREMLIDIIIANMEVILNFKRCVIPKIQSMVTAFNAVKLDLHDAKQELEEKEELKKGKKCFKCTTTEKELAVLKRKQAINESRIKSIAKILTHHVPATLDVEGTDDSESDSDQSAVTKAYNLVSQMLGCDPLPENESEDGKQGNTKIEPKLFKNRNLQNHVLPPKNKDTEIKISPSTQKSKLKRNSEEKKDSVDDILVCSLVEVDEENGFEVYLSPRKTNRVSKPHGSPVLGKIKKTPVRSVQELSSNGASSNPNLCDFENSFCVPPSPACDKNSRNIVLQSSFQSVDHKSDTPVELQRESMKFASNKKTADFWKLKTVSCVDQNNLSLKKEGTKLRQAKLSLGCFPKKIDLCDLEEFNGGIRKSQTSTQISDQKSSVSKALDTNIKLKNMNPDDDDIVIDSPDGNISAGKRKPGRLFSSGRKLSYAGVNAPVSSKVKSFDQPSDKGSTSRKDEDNLEDVKGLDDSFDCVKKVTVSPKYKYRGATVRRKNERQQLSGWDCENCKKYYEAVGGDDASEEELRKLMNQCSRHRDKNPVRPRTPPGFWDAEFPPTPDCEALNQTYMDILPKSKKQKTLQ